MEGSHSTLIFVAVLLPVLHLCIAAYFLVRFADKKANWNITLYRAVLGQFAVLIVALLLVAGLIAATRALSMLGTVESLLAAPLLFLLFYWIGQNRLVFYLAKHDGGRRKFLQPWELRRIGFLTLVQMIYFYIVVCLIAIGAITYTESAKQGAGVATGRQLAMGIPPGIPD